MVDTVKAITLEHIHTVLKRLGGFRSIYIPEFTFNGLRVDALVLDTAKRWGRGFEIKMSRADFLADEKWMLYSQFCSSLSMVCPIELIRKDEVPSPFGLLWIKHDRYGGIGCEWAKKPKRFQRRDGMAWIWTYLNILEAELPRLHLENERLKCELKCERHESEQRLKEII